jgi:2-methylaconitate isomerase
MTATEQLRLPAVLMRGGTSKGLFFHGGVLPEAPAGRDAVLLRALGAPDPYGRQIDGLGGGTSSTSKAVIVSPSRRPGVEVDYFFAQVSVETPLVDVSGSCGNLTAAVAAFAVEEGLVAPTDPRTTVRIHQVNTGARIEAHVPTASGQPRTDGDTSIDGVPGVGAGIVLDFLEPGGSLTAGLLPTGRATDVLEVADLGRVEVSLIDAAVPVVLVRAADLGCTGGEQPDALAARTDLMRALEDLRAAGAVAMGLGDDPAIVTRQRPATPKVALVASPRAYRTTREREVAAADVDLLARMLSMGRPHHAVPITGAIALALAAVVPGTLVASFRPQQPSAAATIRIGHAAGVLEVGAAAERRDGQWVAERASVTRTARRLMEGFVRLPASTLGSTADAPGRTAVGAGPSARRER